MLSFDFGRAGQVVMALVALGGGGSGHAIAADEKECIKLQDLQAEAYNRHGILMPLSKRQMDFARGISMALPGTPNTLPPGDQATIVLLENGGAYVRFFDGVQSCQPPLNIPPAFLPAFYGLEQKSGTPS